MPPHGTELRRSPGSAGSAVANRLAARGRGPLLGVVNAGSSSLKFAVYEEETQVLSGSVDGIGVRPCVQAFGAARQALAVPEVQSASITNPAEALIWLLPWLERQLAGQALAAVGHRVVHGGPRHAKPERVTSDLMQELTALEPLAPLHQPHNLAPIRAALEHAPGLAQVACFDTAFHRSVPEKAQTFALPHTLFDKGVRRYGFHGLSYEYIASALPSVVPEIARGRVVVAHLGNGASLCALKDGRSVATTMGFSALDGLPMGTRCGELDPGVVLFLLKQEAMSPSEVQDLLYRRSGMLGLSGISSDFRDLLASPDTRARFAIEVFIYRVVRGIGSLAAALGGLDGIVFTAGIGEKATVVRAAVCEGCAWLGVELDPIANLSHGPRITCQGSRVAAYVIPTDENLMIARHTRAVVAA
jgi:acetate kinase